MIGRLRAAFFMPTAWVHKKISDKSPAIQSIRDHSPYMLLSPIRKKGKFFINQKIMYNEK